MITKSGNNHGLSELSAAMAALRLSPDGCGSAAHGEPLHPPPSPSTSPTALVAEGRKI